MPLAVERWRQEATIGETGTTQSTMCEQQHATPIAESVLLGMKAKGLKVIIVCVGLFLLYPTSSLAQWRPDTYITYRAVDSIVVDGHLEEASWIRAPNTDPFVDIEGDREDPPDEQTRVKAVWNDDYLYIGAVLEESKVWGTYTKRDAPVYAEDIDFEIFLDVDGDGRNYIEFEINALNTVYDLYRPNKAAPLQIPWDIEGLKTAVHVNGTLNNNADEDRYWSIEIAWPMASLQEHARGAPVPPRSGDEWRIEFPRVEWQLDPSSKVIQKKPNTSAENWTWTQQGLVNNHWPEAWGFLRFSEMPVGTADYTAALHKLSEPFLSIDESRADTAPESMARIPGGTFTMGPDPLEPDIAPAHEVTVDPFYIDRREVTVAEYTEFLNEVNNPERYYHPNMSFRDCGIIARDDGSYHVAEGRGSYPVVYVNREDAEAYAAWAGKRLPTEAEWELVARAQGSRPYPWGDAPPHPERVNFDYHYGQTVPVGSMPEGATDRGVHHLLGNVSEIVADDYGTYPGGEAPFDIDRRTVSIHRGGSWASPRSLIHASVRGAHAQHSPYVGFRCARGVD